MRRKANGAWGFATGGLCHASSTRYFLLRLRTQMAIEPLPPFSVAARELPRTLSDDETRLFYDFSRVFLDSFALTKR